MQQRRLTKAGYAGAALTNGDWPYPTVWRPLRYVKNGPLSGRSRYTAEYGSPSYYAVLDEHGKRTGRFRRVDRPLWWPTLSWRRMQRLCGNSCQFTIRQSVAATAAAAAERV